MNQETLETKLERTKREKSYFERCVDPDNARLYGTFDQRAALNITQFPKIQGSLLIRMGVIYPLASYIVEKMGVPKDCSSDVIGMTINYHTWAAGYLAYLAEIQLGLSQYSFEAGKYLWKKAKGYFSKKSD